MVLPFHGNNEALQRLIMGWLIRLGITSDVATKVEWLTETIVLIHHDELSHLAFSDPQQWQDLLAHALAIDWMIFFECSDTNTSYSYSIYEQGVELRCVIQEEDAELYTDGQIQDFEKELFAFSTRYLHEYVDNGKVKKQWITDSEFSLLDLNQNKRDEYYQYYFFSASDQFIYHSHLARRLLIELFKRYVGFEIFDAPYRPHQVFKIKWDQQLNYEIYLKLAFSGDISAQNKLGEMFEKGLGVEKNETSAQAWYQKSADQNDVDGMLHLARLLLKDGVHKHVDVAVKLIQKSVEMGSTQAQTLLAEMYENGHFFSQNYKLALNLYQKSAKQGCAIAPYKIGRMYELGTGVEKDLKVAKRWYHQAANALNEDAQKRLDDLIQYFATNDRR